MDSKLSRPRYFCTLGVGQNPLRTSIETAFGGHTPRPELAYRKLCHDAGLNSLTPSGQCSMRPIVISFVPPRSGP